MPVGLGNAVLVGTGVFVGVGLGVFVGVGRGVAVGVRIGVIVGLGRDVGVSVTIDTDVPVAVSVGNIVPSPGGLCIAALCASTSGVKKNTIPTVINSKRTQKSTTALCNANSLCPALFRARTYTYFRTLR